MKRFNLIQTGSGYKLSKVRLIPTGKCDRKNVEGK